MNILRIWLFSLSWTNIKWFADDMDFNVILIRVVLNLWVNLGVIGILMLYLLVCSNAVEFYVLIWQPCHTLINSTKLSHFLVFAVKTMGKNQILFLPFQFLHLSFVYFFFLPYCTDKDLTGVGWSSSGGSRHLALDFKGRGTDMSSQSIMFEAVPPPF